MPSKETIERIVEFGSRLKGVVPQVLREGFEIAHLHRRLEQMLESDLAILGLNARQVEIMESLYHNADGAVTPAQLADEVSLSRSAITSALDSLEELGHTVRAPHSSDRRMLIISLTPSGRALIGRHLPERYRKFCMVMGSLSEKERALLLRAYGKVLDLLASDRAKHPARAV